MLNQTKHNAIASRASNVQTLPLGALTTFYKFLSGKKTNVEEIAQSHGEGS